MSAIEELGRAQHCNLVASVLTLHMLDPKWAPVLTPTASLPIQFWPGKTVQDRPKSWDPAPAWERLLGSGF